MRRNRKSFVIRAVALAVVVSAVIPATALASWNVKDDKSHGYLKNIESYTNSILEYYKKHGQNGSAVVGVISEHSWPAGQQLAKVDEGFGISVSCGDAGRSLTASAIKARLRTGFSVPAGATNEQITNAQAEICGAIRVLSNIRYNESVELVSVTLPAIKQRYEQNVLKDIKDHQNGNRGFNSAGSHQVTLQSAQLEFDMAVTAFRERQSQYEQYAGLLTSYNDSLGRRVVNGGGTGDDSAGGLWQDIVKSLVGGSVIQAALKVR